MSLLLLGDLGGTNVRFSLHRLESGPAAANGGRKAQEKTTAALTEPLLEARYFVRGFLNLEAMVLKFLKAVDDFGAGLDSSENPPARGNSTTTTTSSSEQNQRQGLSNDIAGLSMSVCGPVTSGKAVLLAETFGPDGWIICEEKVREATGLREVKFLNDFHAVGLAMSTIPAEDEVCLYKGHGRQADSSIAVVGPGTGLGMCYGVPRKDGSLHVCCSEGGMSDFVARTDEHWALRKFIAAQNGDDHVNLEMVVSGTGIFNAYKFLVAKHREAGSAINEKLFTEINDSPEPAAVISRHSLPQEGVHEADPLCEQAIDMFIKLLGVELGNSALRFQPHGGCYIAGGGIAKKMKEQLVDGRLVASYKNKGHSFACFEGVPLYLVTTSGDILARHGAWNFWHLG